MSVKTKRWNDPAEPDDGFRLLICRYRPRGVRKEDETWDAWAPNLGPSRELHAAFWGKHGAPIPFAEYARRYRAEMESQHAMIVALGRRAAAGETLTLLCSSACTDPDRCHRTLLAGMLTGAGRARR